MSDRHFFDLHEMSKGIVRDLTNGVRTHICPGESVMVSVVHTTLNCAEEIHSRPQEQWGVMLEGRDAGIQDCVEHKVDAGDFGQKSDKRAARLYRWAGRCGDSRHFQSTAR